MLNAGRPHPEIGGTGLETTADVDFPVATALCPTGDVPDWETPVHAG